MINNNNETLIKREPLVYTRDRRAVPKNKKQKNDTSEETVISAVVKQRAALRYISC